MVITNDKRSVKKILKYIDCCIILHNLLIDMKDEPPEEVYEDDEHFDPWLNEAIPADSRADERRQRLLQYFKDFVF